MPLSTPLVGPSGLQRFEPGHWGLSFQKHCDRQKANLRIRFKPSLFQHVGTHSSLAGKIQKLKVGTSSLSELQAPRAGCFWVGTAVTAAGGSWISVKWLCFILNYSEPKSLLLLRMAVTCTKSHCKILSLGTSPGHPSWSARPWSRQVPTKNLLKNLGEMTPGLV